MHQMMLLLIALFLLMNTISTSVATNSISDNKDGKDRIIDKVQVYHFAVRHWLTDNKAVATGVQKCYNPNMHCEWTWAEHLNRLRVEHNNYLKRGSFDMSDPTPILPLNENKHEKISINNSVSLGLYNIHSLWEKKRDHYPAVCELKTNLNVAESEESSIRYSHLFNPSFKNFDGYSTISPKANIQRIYLQAMMNTSDMINLKPFSKLIKGGSYVASDCHARDSANANRDNVVRDIRTNGLRVDGLGRCLRSPVGPEGVQLSKDPASRYNLHLKREVISNFAFNMAFENSYEDGYVTEKPFDALLSGSVPIYLGDSRFLKTLMPYKKSIIYLSDYKNNVTALVNYLQYLLSNETAYEEHRLWRKKYSLKFLQNNISIMRQSWPCQVCEWALKNVHVHHKRVKHCKDEKTSDGKVISVELVDTSKYNGKAVRGNGKEVYYVKNNMLHPIPDLNTLFSLNISLKSVIQIIEREMGQMKITDSWPKAEKEYPEVER
jgi:hypothetical protein